MKRTIILLLLATLALGVLLGFIIDRYVVGQETNTLNPVVITDTDNDQIEIDNNEAPDVNGNESEELGNESALSFCQDIKDGIAGSANFVITTTIASGETIADGDVVSGCIYNINDSYGGWAPFEGQVGSYSLAASDGTILDEGPLTVVDMANWLDDAIAGEDIAYSEDMFFDATGYATGTLTLKNENASGDPVLDETITISVTF